MHFYRAIGYLKQTQWIKDHIPAIALLFETDGFNSYLDWVCFVNFIEEQFY